MANSKGSRPEGRLFLKSVVGASVLSFSTGLLVALMLRDKIGDYDTGMENKGFGELFLHAVMLAPFLETGVMVAVISGVLLPVLRHRWMVAIASALLFALAHGFFLVAWGMAVFAPFVVFSFMYMKFRDYSWRWGFVAAFLTHALHNLIVISLSNA